MIKRLFCCLAALVLAHSALFGQNLDQKVREQGLVDVQMLDTTIVVALAYATEDNFMKTNMYGDLKRAYLQLEIAERVVRASARLAELKPGHRFLILDAARPVSVQKFMYASVKGTPNENYLANPTVGGRHNYGIAVDITIIDPSGKQLDMGTPFDSFDPASHTKGEAALVASGAITQQAADNRLLLISLMEEQGMRVNKYEWWHFDRYTIPEMKEKFRLLDF